PSANQIRHDLFERPRELPAFGGMAVVKEDDRAAARMIQHSAGNLVCSGTRPVERINVPADRIQARGAGYPRQATGEMTVRRAKQLGSHTRRVSNGFTR